MSSNLVREIEPCPNGERRFEVAMSDSRKLLIFSGAVLSPSSVSSISRALHRYAAQPKGERPSALIIELPPGATLEVQDLYPWPHPKPITCPGEAMRATMAFDSRDWSIDKKDAWLYGIVCGWANKDDPDAPDEDAMSEVAEKHRWSKGEIERLKALHKAFDEAFPQPWEDTKSDGT